MAILEVGPDYSKGWSGEQSGTTTSYKEYYRVITDGADALPIVRDAYGVPAIGHAPEYDLGVVLTSKSVRQEDERFQLFSVECNYSSSVNAATLEPNPLSRPVVTRWIESPRSRPVDIDAGGEPITMSSGEYPEPLPEIEEIDYILQVTRNEVSFDISTALEYAGKVNSFTFLGLAAQQVFCKSILGQGQTVEGVYTYEPVIYQFAFRRAVYDPDGVLLPAWAARFLDQGYYKLSGGSQKQILINGFAPPKPVPLDGSGAQQDPGDPPVLNQYDIYEEADFNNLGLF